MGLSRRKVREAVVQLLYAEGPAGLPSRAGDSPSLELLLEPLRQKALVARARAMAHLQQGREAVAEKLQPIARDLALLTAKSDDPLQPLADLVAAEQETARLLDALQRELHGNRNPVTIAPLLDDLARANAASQSAATLLESAVPDFPATGKLRHDALAVAATLPAYRDRCTACLAEAPGDQPELQSLRNSLRAIADLRQAVDDKVAGLATHLPELDELIAGAVDNYTPERLGRVDRAILRLAAYEMLHDDDVPPPVAIDEAIELARSFGTTDSPAFVNGVLDRIHKTTSSQSQANL